MKQPFFNTDMISFNSNFTLSKTGKIVTVPKIVLPKQIENIISKNIGQNGVTLAGADVINGRINSIMSKRIDKAGKYLQSRTESYEKRIRQINGILKRTKNTNKIKSYEKEKKTLEKRISKIAETRKNKVETAKLKHQKLLKQVQMRINEINLNLGNPVSESEINDLINDIDNLDTLIGVNNPKIEEIAYKIVQALLSELYNGGIHPLETKLYYNLLKGLKGKKIDKDIDNYVSVGYTSAKAVYIKYFYNHGYNNEKQFTQAVVLKGFENYSIVESVKNV